MGVSILASWRHPDVVVMAPALTEAGQSRSYRSLPSTSLKNLIDSYLDSPFLLSVSSREKFGNYQLKHIKIAESQTVNGCLKDINGKLCYPLESQYKGNGILNKKLTNQLPIKSADNYRKLESPKSNQLVFENFSMNSSAPMGDESENMGLIKSSTQSSLLDDQAENMGFLKAINQNMDTNNFMKEKTLCNDMDQLFKNLSAAISCSDLSPGDFPPPNVEELLQVIKSMENTCEASDAALDAPTDSVEPEGMFPLSGTDLASFERELLDDMMTNFDEHLPDSGLDMKESLTKEKLEDVSKRQFEIERKCERLQRRLKKLQARSLGKHAAEELTGLFEHAYRMTKQGLQGTSVKSDDQVGKDKKIKGVSELALATLINRLTISSINQASGLMKNHPAVKYFGSGSSELPSQTEPLPGSILPKLEDGEREEVKAVAQQLHIQVHLLQSHLDSDVTASSSGGESCDEMQVYNNPHQGQQSIGNRALWRWSQDRAGVASRWTWLQAQISDLEYKIRQHTEYHRQIRAGKGPVVLGDEGLRRNQQRSTPPVSVNGYHSSLPGSVSISMKPNEDTLNGTISFQSNNCDPTMTASRTRPFVKSAYRKRKLLRTTGLHLVSKKAARPVTIRCGCRPPLSCAVCTGRADPTRPNRFEPFNVAERIASVDFSFHPVLSFPSDTSLTVHLDAMMRLHEWQAKANRCNVKLKFNKYTTSKDKDSNVDRRQRLKKKMKLSEHKNLRKIRKHTAAALSAKLKKKWSANERKRRDLTNSGHLPLSHLKIKKNRKHSLRSNLDGESDEDGDVSMKTIPGDRDGRSSRRTTPESSPGPFISSKDRIEKRDRDKSEDGRRRREDDSYDIDNIVIPYSMAAVKKVEKLQYKEILTPKWRIVEDYEFPNKDLNEEEVKEAGLESETEDISDEVFIERHNRCEESEKKKFMSYIKLPFAVRSRANRRTDSRAESSGANTPDPLSPLNPDHPESGSTVSPLTTPPSTPLSVFDEQYQPINIRKRTISSSRVHLKEKLERASSDKDKEDRCSTPDFEDEVLPYEPRTYPLTDEVYEEMMRGMPLDHAPLISFQHLPTKSYNIDHRMPESPSTSSTISAVEEDPNDPEWTVVNGRDFRENLEYRARNKR